MPASIKASHPISFNFFNDDDQPVLEMLDDVEGLNLKVEITNISGRDLKLVGLAADEAASDKYHFELLFKPGILNPKSQITVGEGDGDWRISKSSQMNGGVVLYLLCKKDILLAAGAATLLTLHHVSAASHGDSHGTLVELKYKNLQYMPGAGSHTTEPIPNGELEQHLNIVNKRGRKNIPLHVGIVGSNTILNDGTTPNELTLKITNLLKDKSLPLLKTEHESSTFILSFDTCSSKEQHEWALGDGASVQDIEVYAFKIQNGQEVRDTHWLARPNTEGETPEWTITPQNKTELAVGESIQLKLSKIVSSMSSGQTNLYLRYEHIPGYCDGQFITSLEKSNLIQRDRLKTDKSYNQESYIGIGTNKPESKLHVVGDTLLDGKLGIGTLKPLSGLSISNVKAKASIPNQEIGQLSFVGFNRDVASASILAQSPNWDDQSHLIFKTSSNEFGAQERMRITNDGKVGIGTNDPKAKLEVAGNIFLADIYDLKFKDEYHGIGFYGSEKKFADVDVNGPAVYGWSGGALGSSTRSGKKIALRWNEQGQVGIGKTDPQCTLDIFSNNSSYGMLKISNNSASAGEASIGFFDTNARTMNTAWVAGVGGWGNTGDFVFGNENGGAGGNVRLLIEKGGNVGIGTTTPAARLDVIGDLKVTGSITIGDWKLETRYDGAWGSQNSALYIVWKGRDAARFGTVRDMFQVSIYGPDGNKRGYYYMNEEGDIDNI